MIVVTRAQWGAKPPKSVTYFPAPPTGVIVHYVGAAGSLGTESQSVGKQRMRAIQQDAFNKGYADLEYNFCIGQDGSIFEGRGKAIQSGANGNRTNNRKWWSVCFLTGVGELLTPQAIAAFHGVRLLLPGTIDEHENVAATQCPGDAIESQWAALTTAPPPPIGDDMTPEQAQQLKDLHQWMSAEGKQILPTLAAMEARIVTEIQQIPGGGSLDPAALSAAVAKATVDLFAVRLGNG